MRSCERAAFRNAFHPAARIALLREDLGAAFRILARVSCACFARMPLAPGLRPAVEFMAIWYLFVGVLKGLNSLARASLECRHPHHTVRIADCQISF